MSNLHAKSDNSIRKFANAVKKDFWLYIIILPALLVTLIFVYLPMPGLIMAFMDFDIIKQFSSPFVGLANFKTIFVIPMFANAVFNTLKLSLINMAVSFFITLIFALLLNELRNMVFKKVVQTVSYMPFFLSWISVIGIVMTFLSLDGPVNQIIANTTGNPDSKIMFLAKQELFIPIAVILSLWKGVGWGSVLYLSAIASIDSNLYEAAYIDGANRLKQTIYITLPGIMPTAIMLFILNIGSLVNDNFELVYGLSNPFMDYDVIQTVVYNYGITQGNFSIGAAFSLSQGLVALSLTLIANKLSKTVSGIGLF